MSEQNTKRIPFIQKKSQIELLGHIQRITYHEEESGYTVARFIEEDSDTQITIVGNILSPNHGENLQLLGSWESHPKYGRQFRISSHQIKVPKTIKGINPRTKSRIGRGDVKVEDLSTIVDVKLPKEPAFLRRRTTLMRKK